MVFSEWLKVRVGGKASFVAIGPGAESLPDFCAGSDIGWKRGIAAVGELQWSAPLDGKAGQ